MEPKAWNWRVWVGFALSLLALFAYLLIFPFTRAVFWLSLALCVAAAWLLVSGLGRAFSQSDRYRGKVAGPILAIFSVLFVAGFAFTSYMMPKAYSIARNAPAVGQRVPELSLTDTNGKPVKLADLLSASSADTSRATRAPRGVLLVFYRGYW